jgi:hypothetical protein
MPLGRAPVGVAVVRDLDGLGRDVPEPSNLTARTGENGGAKTEVSPNAFEADSEPSPLPVVEPKAAELWCYGVG